MKTALTILTAMLLLWAIGCSGDPDRPVVPQASELGPPASQPAASAILPSDPEIESAAEIQRRLPHGPADPHYREPIIGQCGPDLVISPCEGFNLRPWPTRTLTYPNGQVVHMPLWFADPADTTDQFGLGDQVRAGLYSPLRFVANLVGLPVTVFVHPIWQPTVTDATPVFPPGYGVVPCVPQSSLVPASQPGQ